MDQKKILVNTKNQSNKFWKYEITTSNPPTVRFSWGRIGQDGQSKAETFPTTTAMEQKIEKKMAEKQKKGYLESDQKKLKKESEIARLIGPKNKISEMHFVRVKDNNFRKLKQYDPNQSVLIEVLDSWSKEKCHYLLNKQGSWGVTVNWATNSFTKSSMSSAIAHGLRKSLEAIATVVKAAVRKFGGLGVRNLNLFDEDDNEPQIAQDVYEEIKNDVGESVSAQVISRFAALGSRSLELD